MIAAAAFGVAGALIRIAVGLLKSMSEDKPLYLPPFLLYSATALLVGVVSGIVLGVDIPLALLGGYAGLDLIDGYQKVFLKRKINIK